MINNGNQINLLAPITSFAPVIPVNLVTNKKLFGGNIGINAGFPFIEDRIQLNSLAVNSGLAHTDMSIGGNLGWNIFLPGPRLTLLARYEPEFGARNRTQGHTVVFGIVWVAKSLVKSPS